MMGVLAHLGGIDEIGVFLIPALLAIIVIRWAERAASRHTAEPDDHPGDEPTGDK